MGFTCRVLGSLGGFRFIWLMGLRVHKGLEVLGV